MIMNSICGCRVFKAFQLAGTVVSRRSFVKIVASSHLSTMSPSVNQSEDSFLRKCSRRVTKPLQYKQNVKISRSLSSAESPQGGGDGTMAMTMPETLSTKTKSLFGWLNGYTSKSSVLWTSAMSMYKTCVEDINHETFFDACDMPDTFQSWFMVNQLHVWMCLVRLKAEGKDGQFMYRKLVEIMWQDVEARMKKLGEIDSKTLRETLHELVQEFYGLIFALDEGLLSHDRVLAAALWRNMFYDKHNTNAYELANLVEYVRRQIQHLDNLDSEELLTTGNIPWLPFRTSKDQEPFLYLSYSN